LGGAGIIEVETCVDLHETAQAERVGTVGRGDFKAALAGGDFKVFLRFGDGGFVLQLEIALEDAEFLVELADLLAQGVNVRRGLGLRGEGREGDGGERSGEGGGAGDSLVPHGSRVLGLFAWKLPVVGSVGCGAGLLDTKALRR